MVNTRFFFRFSRGTGSVNNYDSNMTESDVVQTSGSRSPCFLIVSSPRCSQTRLAGGDVHRTGRCRVFYALKDTRVRTIAAKEYDDADIYNVADDATVS